MTKLPPIDKNSTCDELRKLSSDFREVEMALFYFGSPRADDLDQARARFNRCPKWAQEWLEPLIASGSATREIIPD